MNLLTAIGLSPGGSSTVHIYKQTIHSTLWKITGCVPSWLVIPWHLPYNGVKTRKTSVTVAVSKNT